MSKRESITLPLWKRILFSVVPVTVLIALLIVAELILRQTSSVLPAHLVDEVQFDGISWYQTNRSFLAGYFPAGSPMVPEFKTALFRKEKTPSTFRIMCLGGSTMFGTPYDMNANIQGILRRQLRNRYPSVEFEVINWGASAINSNVIRDFAGDLLVFRPDLIVVYMGHNEYYGPDGVGASSLEKLFPSLTPFKYRLRELRLVQIVQGWLAGGSEANEHARGLMRQVSGGNLVSLESDDSRRVLAQFGSNLDHIIGTFTKARIPVILSDISSNLTFPPFAYDSTVTGWSASAFDAHMRDLATGKQFAEMLQTVRTVPAACAQHPLVLYWNGIALRSTGDPVAARQSLRLARDGDLLKFRAPGEVNAIIEAAAMKHKVPLIRADSLLSAASADGIPDDSLFWEHLHPTPRGYYIIAGGFLEAITRSGIIRTPASASPVVPFQPDSLHVCWLDLAYGDISIQHLTGKWPFDRYVRTPLVLQRGDPEQLRIVQEAYARKLQWTEACYASAKAFWSAGKLRDALTTYEAILEEYPYGFYSNYLTGSLLNTMGERERAIHYMRASISANPDYLPPRLDLGLLEVNNGRYEEAMEHLQRVVQRAGSTGQELHMKANALYGIGAAWANRGDPRQAMAAVDQALALEPGYPDAIRLKEALLQGR